METYGQMLAHFVSMQHAHMKLEQAPLLSLTGEMAILQIHKMKKTYELHTYAVTVSGESEKTTEICVGFHMTRLVITELMAYELYHGLYGTDNPTNSHCFTRAQLRPHYPIQLNGQIHVGWESADVELKIDLQCGTQKHRVTVKAREEEAAALCRHLEIILGIPVPA